MKLNLSICTKTQIEISIPVKIDENIDKHNSSSIIIMIFVIKQLQKKEQILH